MPQNSEQEIKQKHQILVSACLLGQAVRYDGRYASRGHKRLLDLQAAGLIVTLCPEMAAGLPVPRPPAEIYRGQVLSDQGENLTDTFDRGAEIALKLCQNKKITMAILKENSPSCGSSFIYDGQFKGNKIRGAGKVTDLLRTHGITVFSEDQIEEACHYFETIN
ncbi:DUF523 domain-containing protein [Kiloniella laminariae]|uniref:DUF523 domain-containing protein n=1 Tax=Kiloniella laminariae TaxID=454162 RepID=A0ABT4LJD3_9PROT|nr:DUF523 domain-containing protein [Kiloniella laminariae]MCZ4281215.1 DUF523 domain-containing protein [Kiloniella laminariae]